MRKELAELQKLSAAFAAHVSVLRGVFGLICGNQQERNVTVSMKKEQLERSLIEQSMLHPSKVAQAAAVFIPRVTLTRMPAVRHTRHIILPVDISPQCDQLHESGLAFCPECTSRPSSTSLSHYSLQECVLLKNKDISSQQPSPTPCSRIKQSRLIPPLNFTSFPPPDTSC